MPSDDTSSGGPGVSAPDAPPAAPPTSLIGLTLRGAVAQGIEVEPTDQVIAKSASGAAETSLAVGADKTLSATREAIAFRLITLLGGVVGAYLFISLIFSLSCWTSNNCTVQESYNMSAASFTTVFTALIGIVGSVVGFYFGSKTN